MKVAIICSPSATVLEQVLPVVHELHQTEVLEEILCVFPRPGTILLNRRNWEAVSFLERLGADALYPLTPNLWLRQRGLVASGWRAKIFGRIARLAYRLDESGSHRKLRMFESLVTAGAILLKARIPRRLSHMTNKSSIVLWDSTSVGRTFMRPLYGFLSKTMNFSWYHGPGRYKPVTVGPEIKASVLAKTTVLSHSIHEVAAYQKNLGIPQARIWTVGVTRHHPDWLKSSSNNGDADRPRERKSTLLVISRREKLQRMPYERQLSYLQDILTVANEHGLAIKVKPHPMESDFSIYRRVFGAEGPTGRWVLTDQLISSLASETLFAVCYRSYTPLDLAVLGVPTIERLNLVGLPGYDNDDSVRDTTGAPILDIRRYGHVIGASTSEEFFESVERVIRDYDACVESLRKAYSAYYHLPVTSPKEIAVEILRVNSSESV